MGTMNNKRGYHALSHVRYGDFKKEDMTLSIINPLTRMLLTSKSFVSVVS